MRDKIAVKKNMRECIDSFSHVENLDKELSDTKFKIVDFDEIHSKLSQEIASKKIVQCHGVFDLLHIGHIKHLQHAKQLGDILIVSLTADQHVNKGPGRPYFSENLRAEALAALSCVDYVIINHNPTAIEAIHQIKPHWYVKGIEYQNISNDVTGKILEEEKAVNAVGGKLIYTDDIVFSSSTLLNRYFSPYSSEITSYLDQLRKKYSVNSILNYFDSLKELKVLLIGEAIIDIYHFGEAIGKAGKEPVLVTKYHREEAYIGGILAVANNISDFCSQVTCLTMLGEKGEYESFINQNLKHNVESIFHYKKSSPTIVKRRYLEEYTSQKLFEIYEIDDSYLESNQQRIFLETVDELIEKHDLVIVADYGHGLLDSKCIEKIQNKSKFLAVNAQSNAGNHGFNCISKYKKADYVCIAARELQLNYRQKHISVFDQLNQLISDFQYKTVVITNGRNGSFIYNEGEDIHQTPAFATTFKDRVGAGDAVLAITSLCVANKLPAELVGFIGNVVGSVAVNIMGHQSFIEKISLLKHITHLLK